MEFRGVPAVISNTAAWRGVRSDNEAWLDDSGTIAVRPTREQIDIEAAAPVIELDGAALPPQLDYVLPFLGSYVKREGQLFNSRPLYDHVGSPPLVFHWDPEGPYWLLSDP